MAAKHVFIAVPLLAACASAKAQDTKNKDGLELSGTHRLRLEAITGQARAGFNQNDELVNARTTLRAEYSAGSFATVAELWDSRAYGGNRRTPVTTNEVNALELVQAYVQADLADALGPRTNASVQLGRFMLNLGSRRLVAADDYRNTTNGYTGVRADLATSTGWRGVAIYTLPQQRRPDDTEDLLKNRVGADHEGFDLVLWGGQLSRTAAIGPALLELSYFHLGERDRPGRPTRDRSLDTFGARLLREPSPGAWDFELEGFAQWGEVSAALSALSPRQRVRAWFMHVDLGHTFPSKWKPRLSLDYDHASGDGRGSSFGRFDTLFGMRRADLAPAGLYNAIARTNIISPGIRLEATPDRATDWFVSYRPMWLASRFDSFSSTGVRDPGGRSGRFAGHQIDSRIRYKVARAVTLEADGVLLRKGRFLTDALNTPPKLWTKYLSLNVLTSF